MTVSTQSNIVTHLGNGVTVTFPFTFPVYDATHLQVYTRVITTRVMTLIATSAYTVSGIDNPVGGSVTFTVAPASTVEVVITRQVPLTQALDVDNQGGFHPTNFEEQLDLIEMQNQQINETVGRTVRGPLGEAWPVLDTAPNRKGKLLAFTDDSNAYPTIATNIQLAALLATILVAGSGISITYNALTGTITIANTSPGAANEDVWLLEQAVGGGGVGSDAEGVRDVIGAALVGLGCVITVNDAADTITVDLTQAVTAEIIRDTMGTALVAGAGITITPNDAADTITITATGTADAEVIRDTIGTALIGGVGISVAVDDAGDTITINTVPDIQAIVSSATPVTPTFANNQVNITAQAAALDFANPTGTAVDGHGILLRVKDNGTARAITWGTKYRAFNDSLPTTTIVNKTLYVGLVYNLADDKFDVLAVRKEA